MKSLTTFKESQVYPSFWARMDLVEVYQKQKGLMFASYR